MFELLIPSFVYSPPFGRVGTLIRFAQSGCSYSEPSVPQASDDAFLGSADASRHLTVPFLALRARASGGRRWG